MNTLDITFDLETCALSPTAAVMSIGAVAWDRYGCDLPFIMNDAGSIDRSAIFYRHVDLRSQFLDGFSFDRDTAQWWSRQDEKAKEALLDYDDEPILPIKEVVEHFFQFVQGMKEAVDAKSVCLWSQGTDFDIAILKNICSVYGLQIPIKHLNFRDHRTYIMERGEQILHADNTDFTNFAAEDPRKVYNLVPVLGRDIMESQSHNPVYDCLRSINSTWFLMKS